MATPHTLTKSLGYAVNPNAVTFDGELLTDAHILTEFARHESSAERTIATLPIARRDGSVFVMQRFGEKVITLQGVIIGDTAADLESRLDDFKELLAREQKELAIFSAGVKRVYTATAKQPIFERQHFHVLFIPYTVEFVVAKGEGQDAATTNAISGQSLATTTPATTSFEIEGSKAARPKFTLTGSNWPSGCLGLELENTDTGEKVTVTDPASWGTTSQVIIDCDTKEVTHAGIITDFYGTLPLFRRGTNNIKIRAGGLINQATSETALGDMTQEIFAQLDGATFQWIAASFQLPYANATFQGIELPLVRDSGTTSSLTVRIETDSNGSPSGTLVNGSASWTLTTSDVSTAYAYVRKYLGSAISLPANQTLWIVVKMASSDTGHLYYWKALASTSPYRYTGSITKYQTNGSGGLWLTDTKYPGFKILYGGKDGSSNVTLDVSYHKTYL